MKSMIDFRTAGSVALGLCLGVVAVGGRGAGGAPAVPTAKLTAPKLIEMAGKDPNAPAFREALTATLGENRIQSGTAVIGEGPDFLWAIETPGIPQLIIDDQVGPPMTQIQGADLWFETGKLATGKSHGYYYRVGGKRVGGDVNVPAYGPDSYEQPGVPKGTLSSMITQISKIYDGMETHYWVYVPAEYDPHVPAALMVWNDGGGHVNRNGGARTQIVIDNLTYQKKIPVMIQIFVNPGTISPPAATTPEAAAGSAAPRPRRPRSGSMRSLEYDTVSDRYVRFLQDRLPDFRQ